MGLRREVGNRVQKFKAFLSRRGAPRLITRVWHFSAKVPLQRYCFRSPKRFLGLGGGGFVFYLNDLVPTDMPKSDFEQFVELFICEIPKN